MSTYVNIRERIRRNGDQQDDMQKLRNSKIFETYRDILMISAILGYRNHVSTPLQKGGPDGVLMQFFTERDYDIMDMLAYAETKSPQIIKSDDKYEIFSSYANAGFPILKKILNLDLNNITEADKRTALSTLLAALLNDDVII